MPFAIKRKRFAPSNIVVSIDVHPTEPWVLTGTYDSNGNVRIYNLESGDIVNTYVVANVVILCVKFIARKNWFLVGSKDGRLRIFDYNTHKNFATIKAHSSWIRYLTVHPTVSIVLTGSDDRTIKAWDWDKQWRNIQTYRGHTSFISHIAFNPKDPNTFASASSDSTVKMWSIASPDPCFDLHTHYGGVCSVEFYPGADKSYLVTAGNDRTVKVWDYLSKHCNRTMSDHAQNVEFAIFHPNLPIIISGSMDGTVKIWNSRTYKLECTLGYEDGAARCVTFRKDTNEVVVGLSRAVVTFELNPDEPGFSMGLTDTEHKLEHTLSLENLRLTSEESDRVHTHEMELYRRCITSVIMAIENEAPKRLVSKLTDDGADGKAQELADFLSIMVNDEGTSRRQRRYTLSFLSELVKSAQVFPRSMEIKGVKCEFTKGPDFSGGFGFIYKGKHEGRGVCIKAVHTDSVGIKRKQLRAHAGELTMWGHLSHPNVIAFLGAYISEEEVPRICIVSPWMDNGSLRSYLEEDTEKRDPNVHPKLLVRDIISGLQYLHDFGIIHADLKTKNVLVSKNGRAMVADFGISRPSMTLAMSLTNDTAGPAWWKAPELLLDDEDTSYESDMWAFACTCYEIITCGTTPFGEYDSVRKLKKLFKEGRKQGQIIPSKPEEPGRGWDEDVWSVAMDCWKDDPAKRPNARELLEKINEFNCPDDRPSEPEYSKRRSSPKIEYERILSILDGIH